MKALSRRKRGTRTGALERREIYRSIASVLWHFRRRTLLALVLLIAAKLFAVLVPVALKYIVDDLSPTGSPLTLPLFLLLGYALLRFAAGLFTELRDLVFVRVTQTAVAEFTLRIFGHLQRLGVRHHGGQQTGIFARDVSRGTAGLGFLLGTALFTVLPTLIEIVTVIVVLTAAYQLGFAGILAVTFIGYGAYTVVLTEARIKYQRQLNELDSAASGHLVDSLINYEAIKFYTSEQKEVQRLGDIMKRWIAVGIRNQKALSRLHVGQSGIIAFGVAAVMLMAGTGVVNGTLAVGDLILVNAYVIQVCLPLNTLGLIFRQAREALIDAERMTSLLQLPTEVAADDPHPDLMLEGGAIRFDEVDFGYEPSRQILHDVSFYIEPGQHVAVVGGSGSGKSTLARLLLRFYDASTGQIEIDGQDVTSVNQASLRRAIGVVPQDSSLFNNTIAYNIAYGRPGATLVDVIEAAKAARIHDLIQSLPEQYETPVGERGLKLSGGERQRIAIARAILKNPPILIFDEATSALDTRTERDIQDELDRLARGRTTLIIAHRLSTVVDADCILVMDQGRIVERGTHAKLLAQDGRYAQMWNLQRQQSELNTASLELVRQPINLIAMVAGVLDAVRPQIEDRGITLYPVIRAEGTRVTGDPSALQRLLFDLFDNAMAFTPPAGRMQLRVERDGTDITVSISDSRYTRTRAWDGDRHTEGITDAAAATGIPDLPGRPDHPATDHLESPLDVNPDGGTDGLERGDTDDDTDFGFDTEDARMPIEERNIAVLDPLEAAAIMEEMGGTFRGAPSADGTGMVFSIRMPLRAVAEPGPAAKSQDAATHDVLDGMTVFVVDDQPEARELLSDVLELHGARPRAFGTGAAVLEALREAPSQDWPDVLICDLALGDPDGYRVIAAIRDLEEQRQVGLDRRLPAIALSGHADLDSRLRALLAGFQVHLGKPADTRELVATIVSVTGRSSRSA